MFVSLRFGYRWIVIFFTLNMYQYLTIK